MEPSDFATNTDKAVERFLTLEQEVSAVSPQSYTEMYVLQKIRSWLTSVAAKSLGYDAEFREYFRYGWLKGCTVNLNPGIADVVIRDASSDRYAKAIQSKAVTTQDKNAVSAHILKAIGQLMGKGGENPRIGDRWIIQVEIWNPENPWPFANKVNECSTEELRIQVASELGTIFNRAEIEHYSQISNLRNYLSDIDSMELALQAPVLSNAPQMTSMSSQMASLFQLKMSTLTVPRRPDYQVLKDSSHPKTTRTVVKRANQRWGWANVVTVKIRWACGCFLKDGQVVTGLVFNVVRGSQGQETNRAEHYQFLCVKETLAESHNWRHFTAMTINSQGNYLSNPVDLNQSVSTEDLATWIRLVISRMLNMYEYLATVPNHPAGPALSGKIAGWLKNIASTALGYDAEAREIRRYRYEPMSRGEMPREFASGHGDVTLGTGPYAKTIQSKAVSTENHAAVDKHLLKALGQLLGKGGEDPRPGDRWVIQIEIWNNANPWPYSAAPLMIPALEAFKSRVADKIGNLFAQAENSHWAHIHKLRTYLSDIEDPGYRPSQPDEVVALSKNMLAAHYQQTERAKSTRMWAVADSDTGKVWKPLNAVTVKIRWAYPPAVETDPNTMQLLSSLAYVVWRPSADPFKNSAAHYDVSCVKVTWNTDQNWHRFV